VFDCAGRAQVDGLARNVGCNFKRLQFLTPSTGYAVAMSYDADGIFLARTSDGGATWSLTHSEVPGKPEDVFFLNESTGYVSLGHPSSGQLYKTEDGGQTWTGMAASPGNRIAFADPGVGWGFHYSKLTFTTDAGRRWNSREFTFPAQVNAFSLPRRDRGYVVGQHGMIYRYRVVPVAENVPNAIAAPLMPVFDSPLDDQVEKFDTLLTAMQQAASQPGAAAGELPAEFTEQLAVADATLTDASTEAPQFVGQYKNLNLLMVAVQMVTDLPAHMQGLKESFETLKQGNNLQAASTALPELRTKSEGLVQMVRGFFQK
jgi:hypothetical protein